MSTGIALTQENSTAFTPLPEWFVALQQEGQKTFDALPLPTRRDEAWRFASLNRIDLAPFGEAPEASGAEISRACESSFGLEEVSGKMIFVNDRLVSRQLVGESLRSQGVIWCPLEEAIREHGELFRKHFMTEGAPLGGQKLAALHQANVRAGTFLYVPRGVEIALPIEVYHWITGENASVFPHTLIVAEPQSKVTLIDYFIGASEGAALSAGVNDLHVAEGAELNYLCVQEWNRETLAFQINNTHVAANATSRSLNLNLGGHYARTESLSKLTGQGARSEMLAVTVADGTQEFDHRTLQDHLAPGASSDLLYKNSLDDKAKTTFAGLIKVATGAHQTDAYQKVRNLLLSDDAEANSAPGLEILADNVRCTHGATAGQIEPEELFDLLARGISEREARRLIVRGFLQESIDRFGCEAISALLAGKVDRQFRS